MTTFDDKSDHYSTTFIENDQRLQQQKNHENKTLSPPKTISLPQETPRHQKSTFPVIQRPTILAPLPPLEYPPKFRQSFRIMPEFESNTPFLI